MPEANQEPSSETTLQERTVRMDSMGYALIDNEDIVTRIQAALAQPGSTLNPDGEFSLEIKPCALRFVDAEGALLRTEQVVTRLKVRMIMDEGVVLDIPLVGARVGKIHIELPPLPRPAREPLPFDTSDTVVMHSSPEAATAVHRTLAKPPPLPATPTDTASAISQTAAEQAELFLKRYARPAEEWKKEPEKPTEEDNARLLGLLQIQERRERMLGKPGFATKLLAVLAQEDPPPGIPTTAYGVLRSTLTGLYDEDNHLRVSKAATRFLESLEFGSADLGPPSLVGACKKWAAQLLEGSKTQLGDGSETGGGSGGLTFDKIAQRLDPENTNVSPDARAHAIKMLATSGVAFRELNACERGGGKLDEERLGKLQEVMHRAAQSRELATKNGIKGEKNLQEQFDSTHQLLGRRIAQRTGKLNEAYGAVSVDPSVAARRARLHGGKKST